MTFVKYISLAFLLVVSARTAAQDDVTGNASVSSEDQLIAEAIWSLIDFGEGPSCELKSAFEAANQTYPLSAKVAYWQGRFGENASARAAAMETMTTMLQELATPRTPDDDIQDPIVQGKLRSAQRYAQQINERLKLSLQKQLADQASQPFELSMMTAISRDSDFIAAWALLLESSDLQIALAAANSWAELASDNALPCYAKAVLLNRNRKPGEPIQPAVIEALEQGNARTQCVAPDEPWPIKFELRFPDNIPDDAEKEFAGKKVTPLMFRQLVGRTLGQFDALGPARALSDSALAGLGDTILQQSHKLPIEQDVRYLRAFAETGIHLVQSNRFSYGIRAGDVERVLKRLETMAVEYGDFDLADDLSRIAEYQIEVRRAIAAASKAQNRFSDSIALDRLATEVMNAHSKPIKIPEINLSVPAKDWLVVTEKDSDDGNMRLLRVHSSYYNETIVQNRSQPPPSEREKAKDLKTRGYESLNQAIFDIRTANRSKRRRDGILLFAATDGAFHEIVSDCYVSGYIGRRDPCILASVDSDRLRTAKQGFPFSDLRLAQVLVNEQKLESDEFKSIAATADYIVCPWHRMVDANDQPLPLIQESPKLLLVMVPSVKQQLAVERLSSIPTVAGIIVMDSPLVAAK